MCYCTCIFLIGVLGLLWGGKDKEDIVPPYIKHQLLKAQRTLRDGDYKRAEDYYHRALRRLATSPYAQSQPYIEARAVVLDKVIQQDKYHIIHDLIM